MVQNTINELDSVDILVNAAGVSSRVSPMEINEQEWDRVVDIDLKGCLLCAQAAGKRMIEQGRGGNIINVSSGTGIIAFPNIGGYNCAKAALIMLTRQLAIELAPHKIRVNVMCPGNTKTDMNRDWRSDPEKSKKRLAMVPMNRFAEPVEIANAALFLASEVSSFVTGAPLCVDGGEVIFKG